MLGIPINENTVGGAVLLAVGLLAVMATVAVGAVVWAAARAIYRRLRASSDYVDDLLAEAASPARAGLGVVDTECGFNLALHDECELLWDMPAYTGVDRLRDAIRNEQHKGDQ
jgi:hypothetical protein